jgi:hypothetical protein
VKFPRIRPTLNDVLMAAVWLSAASVAWTWITNEETFLDKFWLGVFGFSIAGALASLLGAGFIFNYVFVILICLALIWATYF